MSIAGMSPPLVQRDWIRGPLKFWARQNKYTDCKFILTDKAGAKYIFPCHKLIFGAASKFFEHLFYGDYVEAGIDEFILKNVEPKIFSKFRQYIYDGERDVMVTYEASDIIKLIELGNYYLFQPIVRDAIWMLLRKNLTVREWMMVFKCGYNICDETLLSPCTEALRLNSDNLLKEPMLYSYSPELFLFFMHKIRANFFDVVRFELIEAYLKMNGMYEDCTQQSNEMGAIYEAPAATSDESAGPESAGAENADTAIIFDSDGVNDTASGLNAIDLNAVHAENVDTAIKCDSKGAFSTDTDSNEIDLDAVDPENVDTFILCDSDRVYCSGTGSNEGGLDPFYDKYAPSISICDKRGDYSNGNVLKAIDLNTADAENADANIRYDNDGAHGSATGPDAIDLNAVDGNITSEKSISDTEFTIKPASPSKGRKGRAVSAIAFTSVAVNTDIVKIGVRKSGVTSVAINPGVVNVGGLKTFAGKSNRDKLRTKIPVAVSSVAVNTDIVKVGKSGNAGATKTVAPHAAPPNIPSTSSESGDSVDSVEQVNTKFNSNRQYIRELLTTINFANFTYAEFHEKVGKSLLLTKEEKLKYMFEIAERAEHIAEMNRSFDEDRNIQLGTCNQCEIYNRPANRNYSFLQFLNVL